MINAENENMRPWDKFRFVTKTMEYLYDRYYGVRDIKISDDVEFSYDEQFKSLTIDVRGYIIAIDLGNTKDWKCPSSSGGFDDGIHLQVWDNESFWNDKTHLDKKFPKLEEEQ